MIGCKIIYIYKMIVIVKKFGTYVSPVKVHCSSKKLTFLRGTIMSLGKSSSCPREQLNPFFPCEIIMSPGEKELKLLRGTYVFEILFDYNFCI
jgi:hypothetical protein